MDEFTRVWVDNPGEYSSTEIVGVVQDYNVYIITLNVGFICNT